MRAYRSHGARACIPIYNALDPETHFRVDPEPRFESVLAFLGNRLPDREARVHEFFFRSAAELRQCRFLMGGNGWDQNVPRLANVRHLGHVYTHQHNALNSTPRAVLNVSRDSMAAMGYSPATRVFEAAGAAACLITDEWVGIEQFLEPEREVLVARNGDDVVHHLQSLSASRAREIGEAARRRILSEHTYAHRGAQVEQILRGESIRHAPRAVPSSPLGASV